MSLNSEFPHKPCPQCGAPMTRQEFTPKKLASTKAHKEGSKAARVTKVQRTYKATGPKEVWWQCQEDFGHTVTE